MATLVFLLKRFFAQRLLGLAVVVTIGFTIGVLVAGPVYADASREAIFTSAIARAPTTVKNLRLFTYGPPGFAYPTADRTITSRLDGLPVRDLVREGRGTVRLGRTEKEAAGSSFTVIFREGAAEHLELEGSAPTGPSQIALPTRVSHLLHVGVGDRLVALGPGGRTAMLTVVGTFEPPEPGTAFWYGSLSPFPSPDSNEPPPVLMDPDGYVATISAIGVTPQFVWDVYVDYAGMTFDEAVPLPDVLATATRSMRTSDPDLTRLQVNTGFSTMISLVEKQVSDLRLPTYLVVFQIGAVTLAVLAGVASLVLTRQAFELAVLRSRGFSGRKLLAGQGVQAALSALVAYPLGLLGGMGLAALASRSNGPTLPGLLFPIRLNVVAQQLGLIGAVLGGAVLLVLSIPYLRRTIVEERQLLSREDRPLLARIPLELFVAPVAVFAFVELRNGTTAPSTSAESLDPLVLLTPTLLILALSFLSLRLLLLLLRGLDAVVGRTRRLPAYLAARRLSRAPGASFATSLLLVLAVGLLVVSTSYRAIILTNQRDTAHQQLGADWNVQIATPERPLAALDELPANATGVIRTQPAFQLAVTYPVRPTALGVDPGTYAGGGWWREDYSRRPLDALLAAIEVPDPSVSVSGDELVAEVTADKDGAGLEMVVTYSTTTGEVREATAGSLEPRTATYRAALPGVERVMSIMFRREVGRRLLVPTTVRFGSVTVGGEPLSLADWVPLRWRGSGGNVSDSADEVSLVILPGLDFLVGGLAPPMGPLPVIVSPGIARTQGTLFQATLDGQLLDLEQVGTARFFPSVPRDFVVASAPALLEAALRVPAPGLTLNEVWAMGEVDPRPAIERAGLAPETTASSGPIVGALAQQPQNLALGMNFAAAIGGLGLVVIGLALGLYFAQRRREFEFASLRAMGARPGQITRVLLLEQGAMIVFALAIGYGVGYGILRLVMPYVRSTLGTAFPEAVLVVDWRVLGIALAAVVAAAAVGLLAALRALLRSSVTSVLRGEAE